MKYIHWNDVSRPARDVCNGVRPWSGGRSLERHHFKLIAPAIIWEAREYEQQERNYRNLMSYRMRAKVLGLQSVEVIQ